MVKRMENDCLEDVSLTADISKLEAAQRTEFVILSLIYHKLFIFI